jgi:hypothetical protein
MSEKIYIENSINLFSKIKNYENYIENIKNIKYKNNFNKKLLSTVVNFNVNRYKLLLKIALFPIGFLLGMGILSIIVDSTFGSRLHDIFQEIFFRNQIAEHIGSIIFLFFTIMIAKIYQIREDYSLIQKSLYLFIFFNSFSYFFNNYDFYNLFNIPLLFFNIYIFIKYKSAFFVELKSIPLPSSLNFVSNNKSVLSKLTKIKKLDDNGLLDENTHNHTPKKILIMIFILLIVMGFNIDILNDILKFIGLINTFTSIFFYLISGLLIMDFFAYVSRIQKVLSEL